MVRWSPGDKIKSAWLNQIPDNIGHAYTLFKEGDNYVAESFLSGSDDYEGTDLYTVATGAMTEIFNAGGGILFVKNADYYPTKPIRVRHGTQLIGESQDVVFHGDNIASGTQVSGMYCILYTQADPGDTKVCLSNFKLDGNNALTPWTSLNAQRAVYSHFKDLLIENNGQYGLTATYRTWWSKFERIRIHDDVKAGMYLASPLAGGEPQWTGGLKFVDCLVDVAGSHLYADRLIWSHFDTCEWGRFNANSTGHRIELYGCRELTFTGCYSGEYEAENGSSVYIDQKSDAYGDSKSRGILFIKQAFYSGKRYGIEVKNAERITLIDPLFTTNTLASIYLDSTVSRVFIQNPHSVDDTFLTQNCGDEEVTFVTGDGPNNRLSRLPRLGIVNKGIDVSVTEGQGSKAITLPLEEPDASYGIAVLPNWSTTVYFSSKATTGFTANFGTNAPADAKIDYWVYR